MNVFTVEAGKDKDGKEYDERSKVQLMGQLALQNGDAKLDLMDLTVDDISAWSSFIGRDVSIDVGAFAPSKGNIVYFVRKGAKPKLLVSDWRRQRRQEAEDGLSEQVIFWDKKNRHLGGFFVVYITLHFRNIYRFWDEKKARFLGGFPCIYT